MLACLNTASTALLLLSNLLAVVASPVILTIREDTSEVEIALVRKEHVYGAVTTVSDNFCKPNQDWYFDIGKHRLSFDNGNLNIITSALGNRASLGSVTVSNSDDFLNGMKKIKPDGKTNLLNLDEVFQLLDSNKIPGVQKKELYSVRWLYFVEAMLRSKGDAMGKEVTGVEAKRYEEVLKEDRFKDKS